MSYNATLRGDYTLVIRLDGLNIQGSPFSPYVYISASPVVDVTQSRWVTLTTRDRFGNQDGPAPVSTPQTVDNGDGTYTVTYTATAVSAYDVTIQI